MRYTARSFMSCAAFIMAMAPFASSGQATERYSRVTVHTQWLENGLSTVGGLGVAVDHGEMDGSGDFTTDLSGTEVEILRSNNIPITVLIDDVSAYYVARNFRDRGEDDRDVNDPCEPTPFYPTPSHFQFGSMGGFQTWEEMMIILDQMRDTYPDLISVKESIGDSYEGRPIYFVRISNDPDMDQDRPEVIYNSLHHAREPASLSQLIFYMWHLLENYGTDPEVTYLMDNMEMYFIPCVNPDGYVYNAQMDPDGGGMWRKNRRDNGDGTFGVDLNRNYGFNWGYNDTGSSPVTSSETYRGTAPFSEPETQALRTFYNAHEFRLSMNYHTYGNALVFPWGYGTASGTPDAALFNAYGHLFTHDDHFRYGTTYQMLNYTVNGGDNDWLYGEQIEKPKVFSMTPEVGSFDDGFWPIADRITELCQLTVGQNLWTAHVALPYATLSDMTHPVLIVQDPWIHFNIQRLGQEQGTFTVGITPLDNVLSAGPNRTFSGMDLLDIRSDSIQLQLLPNTQASDPIRFVFTLNNGSYTFNDTVTKIVGPSGVSFSDELTSVANWNNGTWGLTTNTWFSPPSSMTDSPNGDPSPGVQNITLAQPIDLSNATTATLSFMARWEIDWYDHAQVLASSNGTTWIPLCGKYTYPGSETGSLDEPIYGAKQLTWVSEEMDLGDLIGGQAYIRFSLMSAGGSPADGFYFDDLNVVTTIDGSVNIQPLGTGANIFTFSPNPAQGSTTLNYSLDDTTKEAALVIHDALGSLILQQRIPDRTGSMMINTSEWNPGVYFYGIVDEGTFRTVQRLVVIQQ